MKNFFLAGIALLSLLSSLHSHAFERVVFAPAETFELTPLNPAHFTEYIYWAPEAFADFNGDPFEDLLSASGVDNKLELFLRIPNGGFESGKLVFQATQPIESLAVGDWNLDGHSDFAVGLLHDETVIALNQGNATFTFIKGQYGSQVASGDLNNDGAIDLVALKDGFLSWRFAAPGEWNNNAWLETPSTLRPQSIELADFNGDGILDVGSGTIIYSIFYGDGNGAFSAPVDSPYASLGTIYLSYTAADLNGDGMSDLFGFHTRDLYIPSLQIFNYLGEGLFSDPSEFDFPWISHQDQYAVSDFNADGFDDIAATILGESGQGSRVRIMYGPYDNGFQWIDDLYQSGSQPLGIYAINTLPNGAADLMVILSEPSQAVYFRWIGLQPTTQNREATTLRVPEDVLTLSQALRESIEGDVISLAQGQYDDNIVINNATTTISGRLNEGLPLITGEWNISNSAINIDLIETNETTITADNSRLNISRSKLGGRSSVRGFPRSTMLGVPSRPALVVTNVSGETLALAHCEIRGGQVLETPGEPSEDSAKPENESNAGAAVLIENNTNTVAQLTDTKIIGGKGSATGNDIHLSLPGGTGVLVRDSMNIQLMLNESTLSGGAGADVFGYIPKGASVQYFFTATQPGGPSIRSIRSTVEFHTGRLDGGVGGAGGEFQTTIFKDAESVFLDGATGGAGAQAFDHSSVIIRESILNGGLGGAPNGEYGPQFETDETSTIELINTTAVENWFLY